MTKEQLKNTAESNLEGANLTVKDVVEGLEALNVLVSQKLPVFSSFQLSLFLKNVSPIIETYEKERNKLISELGTPESDKDGKATGNFNFEPEKAKEFNDKIMEILDAKIEVAIPTIKLSDLGNIEIEPKKLATLMWLIRE